MDVMADDAMTVEQLQAELRLLRKQRALDQEAIETLRQREITLGDEAERRERALAEALEQQVATSDILRVIAGSPTDARLVLDAVVKSAMRLCDASDSAIYRLDGDLMRFAARV